MSRESDGSDTDDAPGESGRGDRVVLAVVAIAAVGFALRVVGLGTRPFHWDEARVGYWALQYLETGAFRYRPVAGGPLLYHLDRVAFAALGVSERVARLPVAVVSAALPLAALLFRDRLDDAETVAVSVVLAVQPVVLYYSRFLRGDVPLACFGLAAVGFAVRAWDRRSRRDAYAVAVALPLAAAASGFVAGYLLSWLGAWLLVVDQRSVASDGGAGARTHLAALRDRLAGTATPAARAGLLATAVTAVLFAPRSGSGPGVGLDDPATIHLAVYEGTVGAVRRFVGVRIVHRFPDGTHAILPYLGDAGGLLVALALPVTVLGVGTTLHARYAIHRRPLVEGVGYWGVLAMVVFPTIAEISAPWTLVHVVVPLSLPAAVGLVGLLRRGASAATTAGAAGGGAGGDAGTAVAVLLLVCAVGAGTAAVGADVYTPPDRTTELAQFAQPADDLEPIEAAARAAADRDPATAEVVYVGSSYHVPAAATTETPPVGDAWGNRLPLPWYVASAGADATSTENASTFGARYGNDTAPPVVIAEPTHRGSLAAQLGESYEPTTYRLGLWNREVVVFVGERADGG
ncbi:flippase activity-associated protein Agl23 [Halobellus ruber]|uniref:TIGR03663 family protein n=1 Tax=Halobellus ruber TaxID=2761102 RepID=A0A7J9SM23_9EURY|nr:flippase activity-associated protein Agl23 [Halobellus ruber]MBB6646071.1 TIGR03663 family protein [Halobellus ruber]